MIKTQNTITPYLNTTIRDYIDKQIIESSDILGVYYPLTNFIASNPVKGLEKYPFDMAAIIAKEFLGAKFFTDDDNDFVAEKPQPGLSFRIYHRAIDDEVNAVLIKYLSLFCDQGQAKIQYKASNFFKTFRLLAIHDGDLRSKLTETIIANASDDLLFSIEKSLIDLKIDSEFWQDYFRSSLAKLPGWTAYINYYESNQGQEISITQYLAVRFLVERILICQKHDSQLSYKYIYINDYSHKVTNLERRESEFRSKLIEDIKSNLSSKPVKATTDAQLVFCIDVRSEPFRKRIEESGSYETLGFAGFFGVPVGFKTPGHNHKFISSCPVLIKPKYFVEEKLNDKHSREHIHNSALVYSIFGDLKYNPITVFNMAEAAGTICSGLILLRSISKRYTKNLFRNFDKLFRPKLVGSINLEKDSDLGIDLEDQINMAENSLKMMGLYNNFSELVLFCGHRSSTKNNAYASALQCGACGGNHGSPNARILAQILNNKNVRKALESRNIVIPDYTIFIGAEHDTCTDDLEIFDNDLNLSKTQSIKLSKLKQDLVQAKIANNLQRLKYFGDLTSPDIRSSDWSQVRPEWGLANNAAFIIAPRKVTQNLHLNGRAFLHSYDYTIDAKGSYLETIINAPLIVAQWINSQYYFSTVDNVNFGSASKITHNIVGKIGVMQGNASDLMHGLPLQSVMKNDKEPFHEALRLTAIVYAPQNLVDEVLARSPKVQELIKNKWINLTVIEPVAEEVKA